ncbi:MAG: HRDC domain-containing protein [Candidatus Geothermincolales bacterium]
MAEYLLIEDRDGLLRAVEELRRAGSVAVDLESDSFHHYRERICLVQISDGRKAYVVDALKLDLEPLAGIFAEPGLEKVFHDIDYDGRMILTHVGVRPYPVFDTMVAARFLGRERVGLSDLLLAYEGVELDKSLQRADWSRRPLKGRMLEYAALDVLYLIDLKKKMEEELTSLGRIDWAREEFDYLVRSLTPLARRDFDFTRVKGWRNLDPGGLAVLQRLGEWREEKARELDLPPFRVISSEKLLRLAETMPIDMEGLRDSGILSRGQLSRYGDEILGVITSCLAKGEMICPEKLEGRAERDARAERVMRCLRKAREEAAGSLGLDPGFLLPNSQLREIARSGIRALGELEKRRLIRSWQVEALGPGISRCLEGSG